MGPESLQISTERSRIDVDLVHRFLAGSYWAAGRRREVVERTIQNSVCFGGYVTSRQVAFGRMVTDSAVVAYFADIFVLPEWRGRGFGKALVQAMVEYTDTCGVSSTLLRSQDAPGLYEQFRFEMLPGLLGLMRRHGSAQGPALRAQP
jgi:GNAT superfamily N-acetyltransferase